MQLPNADALRQILCGSLLEFTKTFYKARTGRDFVISQPVGRESHHLTISKALTRVFNGKNLEDDKTRDGATICVPPRYGKTELAIHFVAKCLAQYPDCNFIYVSYAHMLAKKQTQTIRDIMMLPAYRDLFGVRISDSTSAKDNFETTAGGSVYGVGAGGTITGRGAGIQNCNRFGGAIIIDDIHKPSEVTSDTMRQAIIDWFFNTVFSRKNSPQTPIIFIGQRLHEDDLAAHLMTSGNFEQVIIPALDAANNSLNPMMHDLRELQRMEREMPYEYAAQYQQNPQPAGGGIFKPEWFVKLDSEPLILKTFITADTAESEKDYADATVFSFWGVYKIIDANIETDLWGLHWIDCMELRCEPKDLHSNFLQFYTDCMRYKVKPLVAAIEKKSTGSTLISILHQFRGLQILEIERTRASGNKVTRFLATQPTVAARKISLPTYGKHTDMCIEHCRKITANMSHRHDDICDTLADAVEILNNESLIIEYKQSASIHNLKISNPRIAAQKIRSKANASAW